VGAAGAVDAETRGEPEDRAVGQGEAAERGGHAAGGGTEVAGSRPPHAGPARLPENERPAATVAGGVGVLTPPLACWDPADDLGADYVTRAWRGLGEEACGWVVDLRGPGADVFTLLMALAPLLGPGRAIGSPVRRARRRGRWPGTAR
jgi:hypothetical protein